MSKLGGLELGLFNFGKREDEDLTDIKDSTGKKLTRRQVLKTGIATAGAFVASQIPGNAEAGNRRFDDGHYDGPTGIYGKGGNGQIIGDENFPINSYINGIPAEKPHFPTILPNLTLNPIGQKIDGIPPGISLAGKLYSRAWLVRDNPQKLVQFIPELDYKNEPASYLIASYLYENPWEIATHPKFANLSENDPMTQFAIEIGQYVNRYLRGIIEAQNKIIEPAHNAIQITSKQSINDLIKNGIKNIDKIPPRDLKILIWATTWLINHLDGLEGFNYKPYYTNIEMQIRNKQTNLKVRGTPFYYMKNR